MKTIIHLALALICALPACGGNMSDDEQQIYTEIGGASNANTAPRVTGGSTATSSTSTLNSTGGSFSDTVIGGSPAVQTTVITGGSTSIGAGGTSSTGGSTANVAGSTSMSTGGTAGTTSTACKPEIHVTILSHSTTTILPGTKGLVTLETQQVATCKNIEVKSSDYQIVARGRDATDATPYENNFTNIRLYDAQTAAVIGGPLTSPKEYTANDHGHLTFVDSYMLEKDKARAVTVTLDIPATFNSGQVDTSYSVYFLGLNTENGDIPITVSYADNFNSLNWPTFTVTNPPLVVSLSKDTPASKVVTSGKSWGDLHTFSGYVVKNKSSAPQTIASIAVSGDISKFIDVSISVCDNNLPAGVGQTIYAPKAFKTNADGSVDAFNPNTSAHFMDDTAHIFDFSQSALSPIQPNQEIHLCVFGLLSANQKSGDQVSLKLTDLTDTNGFRAYFDGTNEPPKMTLQ